MLLERFETKGLSHYAYALGCEESRELIIIDPIRDIDTYRKYAAERGYSIVAIFETHIHADYASGAHEFSSTGVPVYVSGHDQGETYEVSFPHRDFFDGDTLSFGTIGIRGIHTPGHTPEHMSYLVESTNSSEPPLLFSGDFLFVGAVGRPDLLGEEQKATLAKQLYSSLTKKLAQLPDETVIYPAHGAGSMCGAGIQGPPSSTIRNERLANPYLEAGLSQTAFLEKILAHVPPFPAYYKRMKQLNSVEPRILEQLPEAPALPLSAVENHIRERGVVVDLRDYLSFGAGHIPNSLSIGLSPQLALWAAWVVPPATPIIFIAPNESAVEQAVRAFVRVGLDDVVGFLDGGFSAWANAGKPVSTLEQITAPRLSERLTGNERLQVLDVRSENEWNAGHINGARRLGFDQLAQVGEELRGSNQAYVTICGGGYRSSIAASVLKKSGVSQVCNLNGGMRAWFESRLPISR